MKTYIKLFIFILGLSFSSSLYAATVSQTIELGRLSIGVNVNTGGGDPLTQMRDQLNRQSYATHVRLARLTSYFDNLYLSALVSNHTSELSLAISELERIYALALATPVVDTQRPELNKDAAAWANPKITAIRVRLVEITKLDQETNEIIKNTKQDRVNKANEDHQIQVAALLTDYRQRLNLFIENLDQEHMSDEELDKQISSKRRKLEKERDGVLAGMEAQRAELVDFIYTEKCSIM